MLDSLSTRQKQIGSVILTFVVYAFLLSWKSAILMVIGVGFHEYSHLFAARKLGLKTKGFYLMPFLGGVAFINDRYLSLRQNAIVSLAGPLGGGLLALVCAIVYWSSGVQFFGEAAVWMAILNGFNLLPLSFLDGGQVMGTITYSINRTLGFYCLAISTAIAVVLLVYLNPFLAGLIGFLGGLQVYVEYKNLTNYKQGNLSMCTESYLNPPKALSRMEMAVVIWAWLTMFLGLLYITVSLAPIYLKQ